MRIVYGVHGYGQGHATRALTVLPDLTRRHQVLILAGGDAYEALRRDYPVVRVPTLTYAYSKQTGRCSTWQTGKRNLPMVLDWTVHGPTFRRIADLIKKHEAQCAISDAELWTHRVAARLGLPRIGFDHFGVLTYCRPAMSRFDRLLSLRDVLVYRLLMGKAHRIIVSSFYNAPSAYEGVRVVGPLLRSELLDFEARRGDHLLAYFNNGATLFSDAIEQALRALDCPVIIYGTSRRGRQGRLEFRPRGNRDFIEALASCRAVISTAGNQLVGEAIHYGKPMLVMPEDAVEQRVNAMAIEQLGIGMQVPRELLSEAVLRTFLDHEPDYVHNIRQHARDGKREALDEFERFFREVAEAKPSLQPTLWPA